MRMLHTMLRVGNLDKSLAFYQDVLGMKLLRKNDYPEGKFTLAFVGYGDESDHTVLELTHNWDTERYDLGNAYGHIEIGGPGWYPLLYQTADINPYNGAIEGSRMIADRSGLELVTESMRPLHTGDFGGLWVKLIWFFFGLILSMMVLSGLLIWTKRTALATANALKRSEKPRRPAAVTAHSPQPEEANV